MTPDRRLLDLFRIDLPILAAPMAGAAGVELAVAVASAGGLGSIPCAMLPLDAARAQVGVFRQRVAAPVNMNFFCHTAPTDDPTALDRWRQRLGSYYRELGVPLDAPMGPGRNPFDEAWCAVVEELKPEIVSFHFGLPPEPLMTRVRATGAKIIASATTVAEARYLAEHGCDAIIAQGAEAGGHRGIFLDGPLSAQPGTFALVPQVADAVGVPVIAAGGIADGRGMAAAFALGAAAVQIGTAYLRCPESLVSNLHRAALGQARDDQTVLTNVFTGRPARGILNRLVREVGPIAADAPPFPTATGSVTPIRTAAEAAGSADFSPLWAGQAVALGREGGAAELTRQWAAEAEAVMGRLFAAAKNSN